MNTVTIVLTPEEAQFLSQLLEQGHSDTLSHQTDTGFDTDAARSNDDRPFTFEVIDEGNLSWVPKRGLGRFR